MHGNLAVSPDFRLNIVPLPMCILPHSSSLTFPFSNDAQKYYATSWNRKRFALCPGDIMSYVELHRELDRVQSFCHEQLPWLRDKVWFKYYTTNDSFLIYDAHTRSHRHIHTICALLTIANDPFECELPQLSMAEKAECAAAART